MSHSATILDHPALGRGFPFTDDVGQRLFFVLEINRDMAVICEAVVGPMPERPYTAAIMRNDIIARWPVPIEWLREPTTKMFVMDKEGRPARPRFLADEPAAYLNHDAAIDHKRTPNLVMSEWVDEMTGPREPGHHPPPTPDADIDQYLTTEHP